MTARYVLNRLGAIVLGVGAGLLLIEAGLWGVSAFAPAALSRALPEPGGDDVLRVLCVGDSHTYGVMVEPGETYPARLQHHLQAAGIPARVWNLGIPGQNSRQVLNRLPGYLARYAPHVVAVFVGTNNDWNIAERNLDRPWWERLGRQVRLVRFARLLWRRQEDPEPPGERARLVDLKRRTWQLGEEVVRNRKAVGPKGGVPDEVVGRWIHEDLVAIVRLAREHGADALLVTYPLQLGHLQAVNDGVRTAAAESGALLVDSNAIVNRLWQEGQGDLIFSDPGYHPRPPLYDEIAQEAARSIAARFAEARSVAANPDGM